MLSRTPVLGITEDNYYFTNVTLEEFNRMAIKEKVFFDPTVDFALETIPLLIKRELSEFEIKEIKARLNPYMYSNK